MSENIKTCYSC